MSLSGELVTSVSSRPYRLAQKIIVAAFKILIPDVATRLEGIGDIVNIIAANDEAQTFGQLLEGNARHLSKRLSSLEEAEFPGLPEVEKNLAISAVSEAIDGLSLTKSEIISERLSQKDLYRKVSPLAQEIWKRFGLSGRATSYGERYLQEATAFIITFVQRLPDFSDELLIANYDLTQKIHDLLQLAISNVVLPRYREGHPDEVVAFESEYQTSVISNNDTMEVFGIGVKEELRQQPIEVAYITLKAITIGDPVTIADQLETSEAAGQFDANDNAADKSEPNNTSRPALRVDEAFAEVLKATLQAADEQSMEPPRSRGARILLTGRAGSGKTTISQWLSIKAAQHRFRDDLKPWNVCTPFRVALRDIFPGASTRQPSIHDLVQPSSLRHNMPGNWLDMRLSQECLVIFDGLDELSSVQKRIFGNWASGLSDKYPYINVVITSRPEGVDGEWFSDRHYVQLDLQHMSPLDIRRCIDAWFRALIGISGRGHHLYRKHQLRLITDMENQDVLRELAATPLLCAMLCAFYAYNHSASAPETRGELYEEVISTLVHEREHERDRERSEAGPLGKKQKMALLKGLARYMQEESSPTIETQRTAGSSPANEWPTRSETETAREVIERRLPRMSLLDITAKDALEILLDRSVVFRRVGYRKAHFAHRTIQEYLAAADYADDGDFNALVSRANEPAWWRVIAFAAGQFSMRDASALTAGILRSAGESAPKDRRSLILLAAECYIAVGGLQEEVASSLRAAIEEIFPPENFEEAKMVARGGTQMLSRLAGRLQYPDETIAACVRAAALIGGAEAVGVIGAYAKASRSPIVVREIVNSWQRFNDALGYADEVLKSTSLGSTWISVRTGQTFSAASSLKNATKIRIESYERSYDFSTWKDLDQLEELDFGGNSNLRSLETVSHLTGLRRISLAGARSLEDIGELARLGSVRELYLTGCASLKDIGPLAGLENLHVLVLDGCRNVSDFKPLAKLHDLITLSIDGTRCSTVRFCSGMPHLQELHAMTVDGISYARELASCAELSRIELKTNMPKPGRLRLSASGELRTLVIRGTIRSSDLSPVSSHLGLSEVTVSGCPDLTDLSMFEGLHQLRSLSFVDCPDLSDADGISDAANLETIDLSGSSIFNVDCLRDNPRIQRVFLNRCKQLRDISGLLSIPNLKYVSLLGIARNVHPSPERLSEALGLGRQVSVVYEPLVETEQTFVSEDEVEDTYSYKPDMDYVSWPFDGFSG